MKVEFLAKVLREREVKTKEYLYRVVESENYLAIERKQLWQFDVPRYAHLWELVIVLMDRREHK